MSKRITHVKCLECGADSGESTDPIAWGQGHEHRGLYQTSLVEDTEAAE